MKDLKIVLLYPVHGPEGLGEVGVLPRAVQKVGGEIGAFRHRVNQVALGGKQVDVLVATLKEERAEPGVKLAVQLAVVRTIHGVLKLIGSLIGKRISDHVLLVKKGPRIGLSPIRAGGVPCGVETCQRFSGYVTLGQDL